MDSILAFLKKLFGLGPKVTIKWEKRLDRPMCFFPAPNYWWIDADPDNVCDAIMESGMDGPSIEFCGPATSDEYNKQNTAWRAKPVIETYKDNIGAWREWEHAIAQRGLVAHISFCNTNTVRNNTISDTDWANLANEFIAVHGTKNKIILPTSETDSRTRSSIRSILEHTFRQRVPPRQIVTHAKQPVGYTEHHSQKGTDIPRGDKDNITVADSGPAIGYLYGGNWQDGGTPNVANISTYVKAIRAAGTSGAVYSFGRKFDKTGCKAAGKAWGK